MGVIHNSHLRWYFISEFDTYLSLQMTSFPVFYVKILPFSGCIAQWFFLFKPSDPQSGFAPVQYFISVQIWQKIPRRIFAKSSFAIIIVFYYSFSPLYSFNCFPDLTNRQFLCAFLAKANSSSPVLYFAKHYSLCSS